MSRQFSIDPSTRNALATIHPQLTEATAVETFMLLAWSMLAPAGDKLAALFIKSLGATNAMLRITEGITAEELSASTGTTLFEARGALDRWSAPTSFDHVAEAIQLAAADNVRLLTSASPEWPTTKFHALERVEAAPLVLWAKGDLSLLANDSVAFAGARAATGYGSHITAELVTALDNLTIVSGIAYGIEATALRAALANGQPQVAVLASGIDRPYPRSHESLHNRISEKGLLVTEFAPGTVPTRWRFLAKNRLIAALANTTIITEAGRNSGSLNLAGWARQLGKPVGAVPGPITSAASTGCHWLISAAGANLVTSAEDVLHLVDATSD